MSKRPGVGLEGGTFDWLGSTANLKVIISYPRLLNSVLLYIHKTDISINHAIRLLGHPGFPFLTPYFVKLEAQDVKIQFFGM